MYILVVQDMKYRDTFLKFFKFFDLKQCEAYANTDIYSITTAALSVGALLLSGRVIIVGFMSQQII